MPELPEKSLAQWYKPANERQVWLHTMFSLRRELQAVEEYAAAQDQPRLTKWAGRLAANYRKISEMVPEWTDELSPEAAQELEQAAASGDFSGAASAARSLGRTCNSCHREYRALVAARFRAPDFSNIEVADDTGTVRSHSDHMDLMSRTLNTIKIASEDERWEAALDAESALRSQLKSLGESCGECHRETEPRERVLGQDSGNTLDTLRVALEEKDQRNTGRHLGEAAVQVCALCHGVHRTFYDLTRRLLHRD